MTAEGNVFKRNRTLIFFLIGLVVVFGLLYALRSAVFPFICGLVLAYLFLPVISWIERKLPARGRWAEGKRVSLIVIAAVIIVGLVFLVSFYAILAVADSFSTLVKNAPGYISSALTTLGEWGEGLRRWLPLQLKEQVDSLLQDVGGALSKLMRDALVRGVAFTPASGAMIFGLGCLPLFLFYLLKDWEKLRTGFYSGLPLRVAGHARSIISIIEDVFGRFVRAQLVLSLVVACLCLVGLLVLGINFGLALGLAVFAGIADIIPVVGPWIGGAAGVIVALAVAPDKVIWVALVYLVAQALENLLLRPRIQASYMRIHPAVVLVLLGLGAYIAGVWGLILSVPLAATVLGIYRYVQGNMQAEEAQQSPQS